MKTYDQLITEWRNSLSDTIYFEVESKIKIGAARGEELKLDLPTIEAEYHYGRRKVNGVLIGPIIYENRNDKTWNDELTKKCHGRFYVLNDAVAEILRTHGWKVEMEHQERRLRNPGTGYEWSQFLFICEN